MAAYSVSVEAVYRELRGGFPYWQLENMAEACMEAAECGDPRATQLGGLADHLRDMHQTRSELVKALAMLFPDEAQRVETEILDRMAFAARSAPRDALDNFDDCV
jgi:hypothetical protein